MSERPPANPADQSGSLASRLRPDLFRRTFLKLVASASAGAAIAPAFAGTAYAEAGTTGAGRGGYLATTPGPGRFPLVRKGKAAPLVVSGGDYPGVIRVVNDLQTDIAAVTGARPAISVDQVPAGDAFRYQYQLSLDGDGDDAVEVWKNDPADDLTFSPIFTDDSDTLLFSQAPDFVGPGTVNTSPLARAVEATDGSGFKGTPDYFVDVAFPISVLIANGVVNRAARWGGG